MENSAGGAGHSSAKKKKTTLDRPYILHKN